MFEIALSPSLCGKTPLAVSVAGHVLTINGDAVDLSDLQDGDILPWGAVDHPYVVEKIRKVAGVVHVTLLFPITESAPEAAKFPAPILVTADGLVALPDSGQ